MAKKLLLLALLSTLPYTFTLIFAAHESKPKEITSPKTETCDAPPPGNFQVVDISSGVVNLSWTPAWIGATHTLVLSLEDGFGTWTELATYYTIPEDSYTIMVAAPGSYKLTNATNCTSGETSFKTSEVRFKIIELSTAGRIPVNPVPVSSCGDGINMNHHWVGFRIAKIGTGISNLFEINLAGYVKRVYSPNQIVAVNDLGVWPTNPLFSLDTGSPFRIDDLNNGNPNNIINIGYLNFFQNSSSSVVLCIDDDNIQA